MKLTLLITFFIGIQIMFWGCSKRIYEVAYPTLSDGKYDSEFPYKSSSKELEKISQTIRKINSIAYYQGYIFSQESQVTRSDIQNNTYKDKAVRKVYYNNSVIGTAAIIYYADKRVALLTCAHVIDYPDTVINRFQNPEGKPSQYIQSAGFKQRQSNFVADLPERGELEVLAMDKTLDIALLGHKFQMDRQLQVPVFYYPFGNAKELEWGSFVYLIGYPKGYLMITKGIVSQPNRDKHHSFLVDALFNKGFSGGVVLGIRDGVPNFELVGMASSVSADFEYELKPSEDTRSSQYEPKIPYEGPAFVEFQKSINYGITFIISTESIRDFLKENNSQLLEKGYDFSRLL